MSGAINNELLLKVTVQSISKCQGYARNRKELKLQNPLWDAYAAFAGTPIAERPVPYFKQYVLGREGVNKETAYAPHRDIQKAIADTGIGE